MTIPARWVLAIVVLALAGAIATVRHPRPPQRPRNLLLITLDTMRADRLPAYGFSGVQTPALDGIAAAGAVFDQAFAAVPLTLPSHASLFTGLYPPRLGVRDNASAPLAPSFVTLAEVLGANGLQTAAFIASAVVARGRGLDQGFDQYSAGPAEACSATSPIRRRARDVVDEVLPWLAGHDDSPFFVWMHLYDTHRPYDLPDEHLAAHFDPYHAAVAYEDEQIARVVDHLRRRGLLDSTMIVVAGDHGESLGEHGEESHGMFLYQEALRVPLIMRGPGIAPQRVRAIARLVDVMPTILDMFGVQAPAGDGVSLTGAETRRAVDADLEVYAESTYPRRFGWAPLHSLRADRFKLIDAPRPELYDLEADPGETHNAIAAHPTVAAAMLRRLRSLESGAALPPVASGMDAAVLARIAALGYIGDITPEVSAVAGVSPDPKDRIDVFNRLTRQQWETSARRRPLCQ